MKRLIRSATTKNCVLIRSFRGADFALTLTRKHPLAASFFIFSTPAQHSAVLVVLLKTINQNQKQEEKALGFYKRDRTNAFCTIKLINPYDWIGSSKTRISNIDTSQMSCENQQLQTLLAASLSSSIKSQ